MNKKDSSINSKKLIKLENQYLTKVIKQIGQKDIVEKDLEVCQKAFDKFCKRLNKDKIGLLRKGEAMLRRMLI